MEELETPSIHRFRFSFHPQVTVQNSDHPAVLEAMVTTEDLQCRAPKRNSLVYNRTIVIP